MLEIFSFLSKIAGCIVGFGFLGFFFLLIGSLTLRGIKYLKIKDYDTAVACFIGVLFLLGLFAAFGHSATLRLEQLKSEQVQ